MRLRSALGLTIVSFYLLSSCSVFGSKPSGTKVSDGDILPEYVSVYAQTESIGNLQLFDTSAVVDNFSTLTGNQLVLAAESYHQTTIIDLPDLFAEPDYSKDRNLYPLLKTEIALIIPSSIYLSESSNPQVDQIQLAFTLSSYNLRTIQPDNLESALRNSALLVNRAQLLDDNSANKIKKRLEYLAVSKAALKTLYDKSPELKARFESAAGFGVFQINNYNVLLYVGAYGKGVIFDNKNKKVIYMYTSRAGTGPGVGYESMYVVFVFKNEFALQQFIGAKDSGVDIGASATLGVLGGQVSFNPEISVYQIYKTGFDLQANWGGTLYFPAYGLN